MPPPEPRNQFVNDLIDKLANFETEKGQGPRTVIIGATNLQTILLEFAKITPMEMENILKNRIIIEPGMDGVVVW